jgi:transcriptional regulator with XRE-family HTH domain
MARRGPDAVDKLVGRNIRVLRLAKGLSQTELADALGVTFQQVQKYEKGTNRVGSGRLLKISAILGVKITDFFEGTDRPHDTARRSIFDQLAQPESFRLVQAFSGIDRLVPLIGRLPQRNSGRLRPGSEHALFLHMFNAELELLGAASVLQASR